MRNQAYTVHFAIYKYTASFYSFHGNMLVMNGGTDMELYSKWSNHDS